VPIVGSLSLTRAQGLQLFLTRLAERGRNAVRPGHRGKDVPHVMKLQDLFQAVRPVLFELHDEAFQYGGQGSCFLAKYKDRYFVFSAAHVSKGVAPDALCVFPNDVSGVSIPFESVSACPIPIRSSTITLTSGVWGST
jgi:hypothetical protein